MSVQGRMETCQKDDSQAKRLENQALLDRLRAHREDLFARYKLRFLGVFGSYVRGEQQPGSDLDLLVEFAEVPSLLELARLELELTDLLAVPVDLVMKNALKPGVAKTILRDVMAL